MILASSSRRLFSKLGLAILTATIGSLLPMRAQAAGTWTPINHAPPGGLDNPLLLSDGTVMCGNGGSTWYKYTPDSSGSYTNGTWTTLASTSYTRLFFSSQVLPNGNVYVAGGEYGTGKDFAELYNSLSNSWSVISEPSGTVYSDAVSMLLPNGNVLQGTTGTGCYIYNLSTNTITGTSGVGQPAHQQNEACWCRLPNDNVLTVDNYSTNSEHYVPANNAWYTDNSTPVDLYGYGAELGALIVLPNGKAFQIGGSSHTCTYTPGSTVTAAGTWVQTSDIPNSLGAVDAPACMMNNGKILCALGTNTGFGSSTNFYEYDYTTDTFTLVGSPSGGTSYGSAEFALAMLQLPSGGVFLIGGQGSTSCYVYTPDGSPLAQGQPSVNSIVSNSDGSYTLTGVGLAGISAGAEYGDDWQMATNYPIVRLTDSSGNAHFGRTYNWSSTTIQNPSAVTTQFTLPSLTAGAYPLQVLVNGNPSNSVKFNSSGTAGTSLFEAEALTVNSSSDEVDVVTESGYSNGNGTILRSNAVNDQVTYLVPNVASGTYTVSVGMKKYTQRGQFQLSASRADQNTYTNIGGVIDEYENTGGDYTEVTVGSWSPGTTNNKLFTFTVTGKNSASTSYNISVDFIRLTKTSTPSAALETPAAATTATKAEKAEEKEAKVRAEKLEKERENAELRAEKARG